MAIHQVHQGQGRLEIRLSRRQKEGEGRRFPAHGEARQDRDETLAQQSDGAPARVPLPPLDATEPRSHIGAQ